MSTIPAGSLLILDPNNDNNATPGGVVLAASDGSVLAPVTQFTDRNYGDVAVTGESLCQNRSSTDDFTLYDADLNALLSLPDLLPGWATGHASICPKYNGTAFYIAGLNSARDTLHVKRITTAGVETNSWAITVTPVGSEVGVGIAVTPDGNTLYYNIGAGGTAANTSQPIRRYDLVNNTPLSDFAAGQTGRFQDFLMLSNGNLVSSARTTGGFARLIVYDTGGSIIRNIDVTPQTVNRLARDVAETDTFWVQISATNYRKYRISDGALVISWTAALTVQAAGGFFTIAVDVTDDTEPPEASLAENSSVPCCGEPPDGGETGLPAGVAVDPSWTAACAGGGSVPTASTPTDAEDWDQ